MNEARHHHLEVSGKNLAFAILLNSAITLAQAIGCLLYTSDAADE